MSAGEDVIVRYVFDADGRRAGEIASALQLEVLGIEDLTSGSIEAGACVVLYQAPWEGCLRHSLGSHPEATAGVDEWLGSWQATYARVLSRTAGSAGPPALVNVGRPDAANTLVRLSGTTGDSAALERVQAALPPGADPFSQVMAIWMAEKAGSIWRTYELLESAAETVGRPAEFRAGLRLADEGVHGAVVLALIAAKQDSMKSDDIGDAALADLAEDLRRENALLAIELQQVHAELHQQARSERALHELVVLAGQAADKARHRIAQMESVKRHAG